MARIKFSGHHFTLSPEGTLYWHEESMLVVSDLHLEKGSCSGLRGQLPPSYDSRETLERLARIVENTPASRILFLGDTFHDAQAHERLSFSEQDLLEDICGARRTVWVHGSHGGAYVPGRVQSCGVFSLSGLTFRHEATQDGSGEVSGRFHPCAEISHKGSLVRKPCFIEDGRKMILPAFGAYAGGMDARHESIALHFPQGCRVHVMGLEKIHTLDGGRAAA